MPLFVASDDSAVAQGASYENKKPQLGICQADGTSNSFDFSTLRKVCRAQNTLGL